MKEFETLHAVIDSQKQDLPDQALLLGAHHDDEKLLNLQRHLARRKVGLTVVTLTNSDARGLKAYTQAELPQIRWPEGLAAGEEDLAEMHRIDIPDGFLSDYLDYAIDFAEQYADGKTAIFTPNRNDEHPDHVAAYEVGRKLAGSSIPLYEADTLNGLDRQGNLLTPDIYVPLSTRTARAEKRNYKLHESQTKDIPWDQRRAMFDALGMTSRRGKEKNIPHAAAIFRGNNAPSNPIDIWVNRVAA